jgi:hypothetical protein
MQFDDAAAYTDMLNKQRRDRDQALIEKLLARINQLEAERQWRPLEARQALTLEDVQHSRFRPMLPHERRQWGCDEGVMKTDRGGYKVTEVIL